MISEDIVETFVSAEQLDKITKRIGAQISADYEGKNLKLIGVLKGSFMFLSDLMKNITIPCEIDFIAARSYGAGTKTSGKVKLDDEDQIAKKIDGYDILLVEDILDSGRTLKTLIDVLNTHNPSSVSICTLLDKPERREVDVFPKYIGSKIKNEFVVGYGLDLNQKYRNLPYIGILSQEAIDRALNN